MGQTLVYRKKNWSRQNPKRYSATMSSSVCSITGIRKRSGNKFWRWRDQWVGEQKKKNKKKKQKKKNKKEHLLTNQKKKKQKV